MAIGEGKYDAQLTAALQSCGATNGLLIVFDGDKGPGFSVHASPQILKKLPFILHMMADQIEDDMEDIKPDE